MRGERFVERYCEGELELLGVVLFEELEGFVVEDHLAVDVLDEEVEVLLAAVDLLVPVEFRPDVEFDADVGLGERDNAGVHVEAREFVDAAVELVAGVGESEDFSDLGC